MTVSRLSNVAQFVIFWGLVAASVWKWGILPTMVGLAGLSMLTGLVVLLYVGVIEEPSQRRRIAAWAKQHGWTYQKADATLATRLPPILAFGYDGMFREVLTGLADGRTFRSFIHVYRIQPKNEPSYSTDVHLSYEWVVLVEGPPVSMPLVTCYPKGPRDDALRIKTGDAAFDQKYCVTGPDLLVREVFGEAMRALMLQLAARFDGAFPWRIEAGVLAARRPFVRHTDMKLLEPTLDALLAIAATIPETVLNTYR